MPLLKPRVRVALYARSSGRTANADIAWQLTRLCALVHDRRQQGYPWVVTEVVGDNTARLPRNGALPPKLLALVRARAIDVLAVAGLDRLTRSVAVATRLLKVLEHHHVTLVVVREGATSRSESGAA